VYATLAKWLPPIERDTLTVSTGRPAQPQGAVEYYLEAVLADGQEILWPATAPSTRQTVVAW